MMYSLKTDRLISLTLGRPVDFTARLVEIAVQPAAFFVGKALLLLLPPGTLGGAGFPLAVLLAAVGTIRLALGRAQFAPRAGCSRAGLQHRTSQNDRQPDFHALRP